MTLKFRGFDFLEFDSLLTEDELLVRSTARQFVEDNLLPIIEECNREGRFPRELVSPLGELGFFGPTLEGYGCAGMSNVEYGLIMQELERGDSGLRSFCSVQSSLVMYPIFTFGSEEQKQQWLEPMARGTKLGCFGLTEPDAGSNPGAMRTRAVPVADGYLLSGEKMWITSGSIADVGQERRARRRGSRIPGGDGPAGLQRAGRTWQMVAARQRDFFALALRCAYTQDQPAAQEQRAEVGADVSEPGALRHRLGSHWRGHGLL
jgi:hypothetical protein